MKDVYIDFIKSFGRADLQDPKAMGIYGLFYEAMLAIKDIEGDAVECGSGAGWGAQMITKAIELVGTKRTLYCYDSWEGFPEPGPLDIAKDGRVRKKGHFRGHDGDKGILLAQEFMDKFDDNFTKSKLLKPVKVQGFFEDTIPEELPKRIAFAFLDGDLYESIRHSLKHVYPRIPKGGFFAIHDIADRWQDGVVGNAWPGASVAVQEFFDGRDDFEYLGKCLFKKV